MTMVMTLAMIDSARDRQQYFADSLYKAMKGLGTKNETLQRIVISRCEIDMQQIKQKFQDKYAKSLPEMIKVCCFCFSYIYLQVG
jgi:hypothetical protein